MKTHVAIYKSQDEAIGAIEKLSAKNFPIDKLSIIERADVVEDHLKVKSIENIKIAPVAVLAGIGTILGILASENILTLPGLEFLNNEPTFIGAFLGFDIGLIIGAITVIIIAIIIKKNKTIQLKRHVENVQYLLVVDGNKTEILRAEKELGTAGTHKIKLACNYCNLRKSS